MESHTTVVEHVDGAPTEVPADTGALMISKRYTEIATAPILHLHRHKDGYIAFAAERDGDDFRPLVSIRASELETWFPLFRDRLPKDAYCAINGDWRLRSYGEHGAAYGYPLHSSDRLRYINAAYVDIDFHKLGMDAGDVIGRVIILQDSGFLPHASMIVKSGRGLWLLWLIHDPQVPEQSAGAFADKLALYCRIQDAIIERLRPLGADASARDAARHIRIPGSLNTKSETKVEWWIQGASESGYVYTLQELAGLLRAATPTYRHGQQTITRNPAKRRGWAALHARRLRDFKTLWALRRGFSNGCRNNAAKIHAWLLCCNGMRYDVPGLTEYLGNQCHPPLSKAEVKAAWKYALEIRRMKDQTISDWLYITPAEAELLEKLPPESKFRPAIEAPARPTPRELQRQLILSRRVAIQAIIAELGHVPKVREMAMLIRARGFHGDHTTVLRDYNALGIESERTRTAQAPVPAKAA
jgi:hypothetical protein